MVAKDAHGGLPPAQYRHIVVGSFPADGRDAVAAPKPGHFLELFAGIGRLCKSFSHAGLGCSLPIKLGDGCEYDMSPRATRDVLSWIRFGKVFAVPKMVSVDPKSAIAVSPVYTNSLSMIDESVTSFENMSALPPV